MKATLMKAKREAERGRQALLDAAEKLATERRRQAEEEKAKALVRERSINYEEIENPYSAAAAATKTGEREEQE